MLGAAVALLYRMLDEADQPARTDDSYAVFALATLLAAAVSIKLTAAVFAIVSLLIGVIVLLRKAPSRAARFEPLTEMDRADPHRLSPAPGLPAVS